jgi:hypothetical protein
MRCDGPDDCDELVTYLPCSHQRLMSTTTLDGYNSSVHSRSGALSVHANHDMPLATSPRPAKSGAIPWRKSRTCAGGACLAIARQQTSALLDDQIAACDAEFQRLSVGVDEA